MLTSMGNNNYILFTKEDAINAANQLTMDDPEHWLFTNDYW